MNGGGRIPIYPGIDHRAHLAIVLAEGDEHDDG